MKTQLWFQIFLLPFYLILFGINTLLVSGQCQINHQTFLIQLKNELQFDSPLSSKLVTWNPNATDCCSWGGVTCSIKGQVIGLDLSYEMISGGINDSSALFGLKNLESLNLANCNLTGTFPKKVLQLESLQILDLSYNSNLYGSLPDFPMNGSLQTLVLSNTNLSGEIPKSIGNLKQLSYLDLSSNKFIGEIPSFKLCKNLTHIDLSRNVFNGSIPSSLFSLPNVQRIDLSNNNFDGLLPQFSNTFIPLLKWLDLSSNKMKGEIPRSFFELGQLRVLLLSSNNLSGVIETDDFQGLSNLAILDLSFNKFSIITSSNNSIVSHLPNLYSLKMASCNLQKFPNLQNHSKLMNVDLSDNKIEGEIPNWIWEVGKGYEGLSYLNLSHNNLTSLQEPYNFHDLEVIDLHSNRLSGVIPIPPQSAIFIDYSDNLFNSPLSESIGRNFTFAYFLSVSNNLLTGTIPDTICNATDLQVLDLSNNHLNGTIPQCLIQLSGNLHVQKVGNKLIEFGGILGVLNLANNSLTGQIEGTFPTTCSLYTLDLHGNSLEGKIPQSLVNCRMLRVLNLGNNMLNDTYPCSLGNNTNLHVLVLRSNRFHGSVHCGEGRHNWSNLRILDIAHNNFNGVVSPEFFSQWGTMMTVENRTSKKQLSFKVSQFHDLYYQDTVTVTAKGFELELVKILTLFTSIDFSSNHFSGVIPETIGQLKALYLLNVSHNEFTGSIPPSIGTLSQLEALDMSSNRISGEIPSVLTSLPFLSVLNLSYNQLEGKIPTGSQFQTFSEASYLGNKGLCGFPLNRNCTSSVVPVPSSSPNSDTSSDGNDWLTIFYGMGAGAGSLIDVAVLYTLYKASTSSTTRQTRSV